MMSTLEGRGGHGMADQVREGASMNKKGEGVRKSKLVIWNPPQPKGAS